MTLLRRLLKPFQARPDTPQPATQIPPRPADWSLTIADLMDELKAGKRDSLGSPEREWALAYQRSLIPKGNRFPRLGDVYASRQDQTVSYLTTWNRPYSGDGEAVLRKGDRVWIHDAPNGDEAIGSYALALDYQRLEQLMVPEQTRNSRNYTGFHFYFDTIDLNRLFQLVATEYDP